jgi:hypothetical protein
MSPDAVIVTMADDAALRAGTGYLAPAPLAAFRLCGADQEQDHPHTLPAQNDGRRPLMTVHNAQCERPLVQVTGTVSGQRQTTANVVR